MQLSSYTDAKYTPDLDGMIKHVRNFLLEIDPNSRIAAQADQGLLDFCSNYPPPFRQEFLTKVGRINPRRWGRSSTVSDLDGFARALERQKGECVFLLRDTYEVMGIYCSRNKKGFGLLANRRTICGSEESYFQLVNLIYKALAQSGSYSGFIETYYGLFLELIGESKSFRDRAEDIYRYVKDHSSERRVIFVDLGLQFTICLFCQASVRYFGPDGLETDIFGYSTYPWLAARFRERIYSEDGCTAVIPLEISGTKSFCLSLRNRGAGAIVGFAVGDSLGFPMAGVERSDAQRFLGASCAIQRFTNSPMHPYFERLGAGQYTSNSILMMMVAAQLVEDGKFDEGRFCSRLLQWSKGIVDDLRANRWLGPTNREAIRKLVHGINPANSGSRTTRSCSSAYRAIPIGLMYRPFAKGRLWETSDQVRSVARITHASEISIAGSLLVASIVGDLSHGLRPETAVKGALNQIGGADMTALGQKVLTAVELSYKGSLGEVRARIGTGSAIDQTLPLAIFLLLKYGTDFKAAVLAASNSFRDDTEEEKKRLLGLDWREKILEACGGNTDGIGALTGAFLGAHIGVDRIPVEFKVVEDFDVLSRLGARLVWNRPLLLAPL